MDIPVGDLAFPGDNLGPPEAGSRHSARGLRSEAAEKFLAAVVREAKSSHLLSAEHFSVDGTLIEAWASMKSFRPKGEDKEGGDGNGWGDFRGEKRSNETHASKTDPQAKLMRKGRGREAKLCFLGHALMENRSGLLLDVRISEAKGKAERETGLQMLLDVARSGRITVGADRGYDTRDFVESWRRLQVTPHVAQNTSGRRSAIDGRTTRHRGYSISQVARRRIEQIFGWLKSCAGLRRTRFQGVARTQLYVRLAGAAYNLLRLAKLELAAAT